MNTDRRGTRDSLSGGADSSAAPRPRRPRGRHGRTKGIAVLRTSHHSLANGGAGRMAACSGHLGVNVPDLNRATAVLRPVDALLGYGLPTAEDTLAFMPAGGRRGAYLFLYGATDERAYTREATGLQHLAFIVPPGPPCGRSTPTWRAPAPPPAHAPGMAPVPAPLFRHVLARSLRHHARSGLPPRPRLRGRRDSLADKIVPYRLRVVRRRARAPARSRRCPRRCGR